jgi:DNA excision repair protein ERCC-2
VLFELILETSRIKRTDASKLQDEYSKLVAGLQNANEGREEDDILANPGRRFVVLA